MLAKLRRFYDCAEDFESGGVDIGRHWLDLLTQLGLLNRVQRSPALWEISQQGEDLLGTPHPSPAQAEQAEAERPEVVDFNPYRYHAEKIRQRADGAASAYEAGRSALGYMEDIAESALIVRNGLDELSAQHERIVEALRFERQQMDRAFTACINERDAANARLHEVATACATAEQERDAALARVAELERKLRNEENAHTTTIEQRDNAEHWADQLANAIAERFGVDIGEHSNLNCPWNEALVWMQQPPAQAQHSVPELDQLYSMLGAESQVDAAKKIAELIGCRMSRSALTEAQMRRIYENSTEIENERLGFAAFARLMRRAEAVHQIAAAPGKEGV
ncbi:TPA: hypothetical protein ACPWIL_000622 [Pseudomonas aeruginosa]|uniref:hypothetical protein n=1 Tax=Pseudomonas aeruginosa TaxID=287 RepID=UPI002901E28E|nr:hypothetical protein [Pseudomonas aeruginosa]MDU0535819.1 hypothetical protein [Pseudomonas aeruginosa]MEA8680051.1 hypothetical protein [Pseudomonas aeruginosa]MEA8693171.1 hypothetical protein [Pseudomonas aeruginosa]